MRRGGERGFQQCPRRGRARVELPEPSRLWPCPCWLASRMCSSEEMSTSAIEAPCVRRRRSRRAPGKSMEARLWAGRRAQGERGCAARTVWSMRCIHLSCFALGPSQAFAGCGDKGGGDSGARRSDGLPSPPVRSRSSESTHGPRWNETTRRDTDRNRGCKQLVRRGKSFLALHPHLFRCLRRDTHASVSREIADVATSAFNLAARSRGTTCSAEVGTGCDCMQAVSLASCVGTPGDTPAPGAGSRERRGSPRSEWASRLSSSC